MANNDDDITSTIGGQNAKNEFQNDLCPAEQHYNIGGYRKEIMFAMSIGLKTRPGVPL
jgi:hypothetical protein